MKKKFETGGSTRQTKGQALTRSKVTASGLLSEATGKSDLSENDIRQLAISKGYSKADTNAIVKGFNQSKGKSIEFMSNMKDFNVFDDTKGGAVGSGKKTGNKKGFDAGDLIGLGDNVNKFAGFVAGLKGMKKEEPAATSATTSDPKVRSFGNLRHLHEAPATTSATSENTGGGKGKGNGLTPKQFNINPSLNLPAGFGNFGSDPNSNGINIGYDPYGEGIRIGEKSAGIGQRAIDLINSGVIEPGSTQQIPQGESVGRFEDFMNRMLASGHSTVRWTADQLAGLAEWMGLPREEQGLFQPLYEMAKKYEDERRAGRNTRYDDEFIYNTIAQTPEIASASRLFIGAPLGFMRGAGMSFPGSAYAKAVASKLGKVAYPYYEAARRFVTKKFSSPGVKAPGSAPVTSGATNSGATVIETKVLPQSPVSSQKFLPEYRTIVTPPPGATQQVTTQKLLGQGKPRTQTRIEGTSANPNVVYKGTPKSKLANQQSKMIEESVPVEQIQSTPTGFNQVYRGTNPRSKVIKERSAQADDEAYRRKGGKLYGQGGIKTSKITDNLEYSYAPSDVLQISGRNMGYTFAPKFDWKASFDKRVANDALTGSIPSENANRTINTNTRKGINLEGAGDALGNATKYALPFIGEAIARKQLDRIKPVKFEAAQLMTGAVQDLGRNFKPMMNRTLSGPDQMTNLAAQKAVDSFNRDQEFKWNLANEASKMGQRENILNRTNQGIMFNTQGKNQSNMFNAQMNAGTAGIRYQSVREPFIAGQQHLAGDRSMNAYVSSSERAALYDAMVKNPDLYGGINNPAYQAKLRELEQPKRGGFFGKKGGKMKIKSNC